MGNDNELFGRVIYLYGLGGRLPFLSRINLILLGGIHRIVYISLDGVRLDEEYGFGWGEVESGLAAFLYLEVLVYLGL